MQNVGPEMIINCVNENDKITGEIIRAEVFKKKQNFRVSHVIVFDKSRRLLLQQLALKRPRHPMRFGSSVAAYLFAGESYRVAAERRIKQELGITLTRFKKVGKTQMFDEGCLKFITVFEGLHEGPFQIDKGHIQKVFFLSKPDIISQLNQNLDRFTPTFSHIFRTFYINPRIE